MLTFTLGTINENHPGRDPGHRLLRPARRRRRQERRHDLDAGGDLHRQVEPEPGCGQGLPRVHRVGRGHRGPDRGRSHRPVRTSSTARSCPTTRCRPSRTSRRTWTATRPGRRSSSCRRSRVPRWSNITVAVGSGLNTAEEGAEAVRPGRREAGQAARPPGLVSRRRGRLRTEHDQGVDPARSAPAATLAVGGGRTTSSPAAATARSQPCGPIRTGFTSRRRSSSASSSSCQRSLSFYFSLTRWTLFDIDVHRARQLRPVHARAVADQRAAQYVRLCVVTSGLKVVLGLLLAVLLTSSIRARNALRAIVFFPVWSARSRSASRSRC